MYFQHSKFQKGHNSNKNWRKLTTLKLDLQYSKTKSYAKFQLYMSKHAGENPCEMGPWLTMFLVKIMVQPRFNRGSSTVIKFLYMVLRCRPLWNMVHHAGLLLTMVFRGKTWLSYLTMVQFILTMVIMIICWCIMGI